MEQTFADEVLLKMKELEPIKGRPPFILELYQHFKAKDPEFELQKLRRQIGQLYYENRLYVDPKFHFYSPEKFDETYLNCSETVKKSHSGFKLDEKNLLRPDTVKTIDIKRLKDILRSSDASLLEDDFFKQDEAGFLTGEAHDDKIAFLSFPRCGNSFLSTFIGQITGVGTGQDRNLFTCYNMQMAGYRGMGIFDDSVWVLQSHFPMLRNEVTFEAKRVFCVVRNFLDVVNSYFQHLFTIHLHDRVLAENFHIEFPEAWRDFVLKQADHFKNFHELVSNYQKTHNFPIHYVRYEDLLAQPVETLSGLSSFLLETRTVHGMNIEKRIIDAVTLKDQNKVYTPTVVGTNKNAFRFSDSLMAEVASILRGYNFYFGYADAPDAQKNLAFFQYEEPTAKELASFEQFKRDNDLYREMKTDSQPIKINEPTMLMKILHPWVDDRILLKSSIKQ